MSLPKELPLVAWSPAIEGCGENLEITCQAIHKTKMGRSHRTKLRLQVNRYLIRELAEQIALMQRRDRERIQDELDRLTGELQPVTRPPPGGAG